MSLKGSGFDTHCVCAADDGRVVEAVFVQRGRGVCSAFLVEVFPGIVGGVMVFSLRVQLKNYFTIYVVADLFLGCGSWMICIYFDGGLGFKRTRCGLGFKRT